MKLLAVDKGLPRVITVHGKTVRTGIFKELVGDDQADLAGHGGEMRAAGPPNKVRQSA